MVRSDKIIEYAAYVRYLRKVTFRPSDVEQVCGRVISRASATSEMHMALVLLRRLAAIVLAVVVIAVSAVVMVSVSRGRETAPEGNVWEDSRVVEEGDKGRLRIYEAYEHSSSLRKNR